MSCPSNLTLNMSSPFLFPSKITNLINTNSNTSTSSNSSPISSRASTPTSESSHTSQNTCFSYNSTGNISSSNKLSYENYKLKRANDSLTMENLSLKLEISKLKADININILNNQFIQEKNYYLNEYNKYKSLYNKILKKKEDLKKSLDEERKKKRKYVHILYEFGLSNKAIRKDMGDFEYSAEMRKYSISKVTKLRNHIKQYSVGDRLGNECFEFTNSSDLSLNINDLKIINPNNPNENISFSIKKLDSSFGCIYDNDNSINYHNHNKSNSYNSRKIISKNDYNDYQMINNYKNNDCTDIINPDDHFLIRFEHPIMQKEGSYTLSYRLFSKIKANTTRYKGNGTFGQKLEFEYHVSKY